MDAVVAKESAKNNVKATKTISKSKAKKKVVKSIKKAAVKKKAAPKSSPKKLANKNKHTKADVKKQFIHKAQIKKVPVTKQASLSDHDRYVEITKFASQKDWSDANTLVMQCSDKSYASSLLKMLKIYYEPEAVLLSEKTNFFVEHPWIPREPFEAKIEGTISPRDSNESILKWFKENEPQTDVGKLILLDALIKAKQLSISNKAIVTNLRQLWRTTSLSDDLEEYYLKTYGDYLTVEDLLEKIEHLTWEGSYTYAGKLLSIVPTKFKKLPKARLEIARSKVPFRATLGSLKGELKNDDFVNYLVIKHLINNDQDLEAIKRLAKLSPKSQYEKWWKLKYISIRNALREKQYKQAYVLTLNHKLPYGSDMADAEWIGGWISLRFLDEPVEAVRRFKKLYDNTKLANSRSKAAYWLARSYEHMGDQTNAATWYEIASKFKGTFYGQLAISSLSPYGQHNYFEDVAEVHFASAGSDDGEKAKKIAYLAYILDKANVSRLSNKLIDSISDLKLDKTGLEASAKYFTKLGRHDLVVELSRTSSNKGMSLFEDGYPTHININASNAKFSKALYLAIIRQESRFDQGARSPAGAAGLMQLMPATADLVAKKIGMPRKSYLASGEANVKHGVAYFDSLYEKFESIPLSIAAYNAGPGNVVKWLDRYGDPRGSRDPYAILDWIEMIPFSETRNYVRKVMENYVIYNSMTNHNHTPKDIVSFLGAGEQ
jgi:soluble lytic murein transglycosylase